MVFSPANPSLRNEAGPVQVSQRQRVMVKLSDQRSGASQSKTGVGDKFKSYINHHKIVAVESLLRLLRSPLQSLLTWLVVAIAIALPAMLYLAIAELQTVGASWRFQPQLSVFLNARAKENAVLAMRDRLLTLPEIAAVDYVSPQQALQEFEQYSGLGAVLETLDDNPLPAVLVIHPQASHGSPAELQAIQSQLQQELIVDEVRLDMAWIQRLQQIMIIAERIVLALASFLALGVLLVIGNTIRLAIENRRDEIIIVKLVGGANSFVRRPFLYTGFWYGLGGGLLAWLLLLAGVAWLSSPAEQLADLYQSDAHLRGLGWGETLIILFGSALLGLLGAALAVSRHLHNIEPS